MLCFLYFSNNFKEYHSVFKSVVEKLWYVGGVMTPCLSYIYCFCDVIDAYVFQFYLEIFL